MGRFEIDDDGENTIPWGLWQHNLTRALRSGNGQAKLREFREALLTVPGHRLVRDMIATLDGDVCAIGAFAAYKRFQRGQTWAQATAELNQEFHPVAEPRRGKDGLWWGENLGEAQTNGFETQWLGTRECGLNRTLAWFIGYQNDEGVFVGSTPEQQWWNAYCWVCETLGEQPDLQHAPPELKMWLSDE